MSLRHTKFASLYFYALLLMLSISLFALPYHRASAIADSSIIVDVTPSDYGPNENVSITLSSYAANLDTVSISWLVNGKTTLAGIGKKSFSITAPAAGSNTTVLVKIALPDGEIDKSISIRPNVMTLLWQADDSYVPPFYRGKAMPTLQSEIKIVAMPEIKVGTTLVDPKTMTYSWKKDYNNDVNGSGYGKNFFIYTGDYLDGSNNIGVTASTINQQSSATANITVTAVSPELSFYKKDNVLGVLWEHAVQNGDTVKDGDSIVAVPYFISPKNIRIPGLTFNWSINDAPVIIQSDRKDIIPLRIQSGTSGTAKMGLEINNQYKIFQTVKKELELNF